MQKMLNKNFLISIVVLLAAIVTGKCHAELEGIEREAASPQNAQQQLDFDALTKAQKKTLEPMRAQWKQLPAERQKRLIRGADRWANMSAKQRERARARMQRWQALPSEKRAQMLKRLERYQAMNPQQRQRLRRTFRKFRQLPEEQREALRERWRHSGAAERRQMRRELMMQRDLSIEGK